MARDNREIRRGIREMVPAPKDADGKPRGLPSSKVYGGSSELQEDELAAAFSQTELNQMRDRGDIVGNWKSTKANS